MTDDDVTDGDAQAEYDADPALQALLSQAAKSPTVLRDNEGGTVAAWVERIRSGTRLREVTDRDGDDVGGPGTAE